MTLTGHYPLHEDSGTTAYDLAGTPNHGAVSGTTQGVTGPLGDSAYSFDGVDDLINLDNTYDLTSAITVAAWIRTTTADSAAHYVVNKDDNGTGRSWALFQPGANNTQAGFYTFTGGTQNLIRAQNTAINDGSWHHIVGTFDGSTGKLYQNGQPTGATFSATGIDSSSAITKIGARGDNKAHWNGDIADVRIYNHALTDAEIQYLYEVATRPRLVTATKSYGSTITPNLSAQFALDGEAATVYVTGSPGSATAETQTVSLVTGTTDYTLSWASGHTDFRVEVVADLSTVTSRPTVSELSLTI